MNWRLLIRLYVFLLLTVLLLAVSHYRAEAKHAKHWKAAAEEAQQHAKHAQQQAADYATRVRQVAETDARYTRELADAKTTVDTLRRDVAAGRRRLRVAATCPKLPPSPAASGVVDATPTRLTPDAERSYWRLRTELETASKQITGLQEYIREMLKQTAPHPWDLSGTP